MPATDLSAPLICCLPHTPGALAQLAQHCAALGLPAPRAWDAACRPRTIRALLTAAADGEDAPGEAVVVKTDATNTPALPASLVLLHRVPLEQVRALMRACRQDDGPRPLVAVTTPTSLDFTLEVLLTHLLQDRAREDAQRATGKAGSAQGAG